MVVCKINSFTAMKKNHLKYHVKDDNYCLECGIKHF